MLPNMTIFRRLCFIALESGAQAHLNSEITHESRETLGMGTWIFTWEFLARCHCCWTNRGDCA